MGKILKRIHRWWNIVFRDYYDPFFKSADGMYYGKMPSGTILRLEGKKRFKKRQQLNELREFFKK